MTQKLPTLFTSVEKAAYAFIKAPVDVTLAGAKLCLEITATCADFGLYVLQQYICYKALFLNGAVLNEVTTSYLNGKSEEYHLGIGKSYTSKVFPAAVFVGTCYQSGFLTAGFFTAGISVASDPNGTLGTLLKSFNVEEKVGINWRWDNLKCDITKISGNTSPNSSPQRYSDEYNTSPNGSPQKGSGADVKPNPTAQAGEVLTFILNSGIPGLVEESLTGTHIYLGYALARLNNHSYGTSPEYAKYIGAMLALDLLIWSQKQDSEQHDDISPDLDGLQSEIGRLADEMHDMRFG